MLDEALLVSCLALKAPGKYDMLWCLVNPECMEGARDELRNNRQLKSYSVWAGLHVSHPFLASWASRLSP